VVPPPDAPCPSSRDRLRALLQPEVAADPALPHRPGPAEAQRRAVERDVRDGLLRRVVGDVVVAAVVDLGPAGRAAALALLLPPGAVAIASTAAWVHAGEAVGVPALLEVALDAAGARRLQREGRCGGVPVSATRSAPPGDEVVVIGPLRVTTPARTLLDVARTAPQRTARVRRALLDAGLEEADLTRAGAGARGTARVRLARRRLALTPAQEDPDPPVGAQPVGTASTGPGPVDPWPAGALTRAGATP